MVAYTQLLTTLRKCLQSTPTEQCQKLVQDQSKAVSCLRSRAQESQTKDGRALPDAPFRLLDLPKEVRKLIYEAIICDRGIHCITIDSEFGSHLAIWSCSTSSASSPPQTLPSTKHPRTTRSYIAILQTCNQIHAEANCLSYRLNTFVIYDTKALMRLQHHLLAPKLHKIRSLCICIDLDDPRNMLDYSQHYLLAEWHWNLLWMPLHTSFPGLGHLHVELRTRYVVDLVAALDARDSTWMNAIKKGSRDVKDGRRLEVVRFDLGPLLKTEREDGVVAEAVKGMERRLEAMFMPLEFVQPPLIEKAVGVGLDDTRKDSGLDMLKAERVQDTTRMNRVKARVERTVIVSRTVRPLFLQTRR